MSDDTIISLASMILMTITICFVIYDSKNC